VKSEKRKSDSSWQSVFKVLTIKIFNLARAQSALDLLALEKEDAAAQYYSLRAKANISRGKKKLRCFCKYYINKKTSGATNPIRMNRNAVF
jgi:hypothetical protein